MTNQTTDADDLTGTYANFGNIPSDVLDRDDLTYIETDHGAYKVIER